MKRTISLIICFIIAFGSFAIGINSLTVGAYSSWQEAYLDILQSDRNNYYYEVAKSVLVYNLMGDSTPELAYPCSSKDDSVRSLRIVTFDGNNIKELYRQYEWLINGGSGSKNCLATLKDGRLGTYHNIGSDYSSDTYKILRINTNNISVDEEFTCYYSYDYVNERAKSEFTVNGSSATEETCKKKIESLRQSISKVLLGNHYEDFYKSPNQGNIPGMTYDEAITYLKNQKSNSTPSNSVQLKLSDISGGYVFSSGAGAWSSELNIYKDGSFDGQYSDTDMAPPTTYYSTYNGKFGTPKKVDEYSYSIKIENLNITNDLHILYGDDYDKMYSKEVKYVPSKPYGVDKTTELIVYPPFTPLSKMATECANSLGLWLTKGESTLPKDAYVLYNSAEGAAFYRTVKEVKQSTSGNDEGNKPDKYTIEYLDGTSDTFDRNLDYYINKADSCKYDPDLAYMLMSIANAAYDKSKVSKMYDTLEFEKKYISEDYDLPLIYDTKVRYSLGTKTMDNGKTLVLVDIAGTNGDLGDFTAGEWWSNADLGLTTELASGYHHGFEQAANYLMKGLNSFISENKIKKSEAIFVVTGHSRGGAVGNIVSCKLGVNKANLFNYNFACPDVAVDTGIYWNLLGAHDNMFNISCNEDIVSMVPGELGDLGVIIKINQWGKYGKSLWFCYDWADAKYDGIHLNSHDPAYYLGYLRQKKPESELKDYFAMKTNIPNPLTYFNLFGIFCPVDVTLTDDSGNVIAQVIDDKVTEQSEEAYVIVSQGHKIIQVFNDKHVNVSLEGTDKGNMTVIMKEYKSPSLEVTQNVSFEDIALSKGTQIKTEWGGDIKPESVNLIDGITGEIISAEKSTEITDNDASVETTPGKINKITIIIIIAAVVVALIIAAIIFIILRNKKKQAQLNEAEDVNEIQQKTAPAQVTAPLPIEEKLAPTPTAPQIEYSCKEMGFGGRCGLCKNETETLYLVTARKDGKEQKATVCRACAERVIAKFKKQNSTNSK